MSAWTGTSRTRRRSRSTLQGIRWSTGSITRVWQVRPYHALAQKYLPKGAGAIFCFGVKGGREAGKAFIESLEMISHLANVGDAKTLVIHPASTTHQQMSDEEQIDAGLSPDLIRISIGLEDPADIIWDLNQALTKAAKLAAVSAGA